VIAYLKGTIQKKLEKSLILNTGQVGYLIHVPIPTLEKINEKEDTELYIYTKVREDDISLYGFESLEQRKFFETIISISGVGPKLGLEILSKDPEKVKTAIISKDIAFLSHIPGIGKKTAERLIIELKNKVDLDIEALGHTHQGLDSETDNDALNAIMSLGYQKFEINNVLRKMPKEITEVEDIVKYFLQNV
jgi:Holliday junction DNA helicase RuvA